MAGILASVVAFFVASFYIKRYFEDSGLPKGMTRNVTIFALALFVSYVVGWAVDHIA